MPRHQEFTIEDLRLLAESRNYKLVQKADHFWLIARKDRLPAVNNEAESLHFTADEARAFLESLTRSNSS